ncbi:hypothetical protein C8T65DRAFT_698881 [Cerioporus squamosus]|nr:hypothetical protein C8T65DRAFT_698881 [Cerioporus squamosus]
MEPERWQCTPPTTTDLIPWQPEPNFRGTFTIFTSCILTLFLCVWSALHVDIQKGRSTKMRYLSKGGWLLIALFCPELLFYIAFQQLRQAMRLTVEGQRFLPVAGASTRSYKMRVLAWVVGVKWEDDGSNSPPDVESSTDGIKSFKPEDASNASPSDPESTESNSGTKPVSRKHRWTLAHGYYAAMGGFVLTDPYIDKSDDHYLPSWQKNGVLTPDGVRFLMQHAPSLIPDLALDDILDRSKADVLARTLLVWQVLWFLLTCIDRAVQGLPLSLLEVITIAHALCSLLTYALWWRKPKDVDHQTVIVGADARLIGAWMSMASVARRCVIGGLLVFGRTSEMQRVEVLKRKNDAGLFFQHRDAGMRASKGILMTRFIFGTATPPKPPDKKGNVGPWSCGWALASRAQEDYNVSLPSSTRYIVPIASLQAYTVDRYELSSTLDVPRTVVITVALGAVYGLPHLIGFTVTFASATERTLWLVGTALVATMGIVLMTVLFLLVFSLCLWDLLLRHFTGTDPRFSEGWGITFERLMWIVGAGVYISSSGYLVVESVRQLFALPSAAFTLPAWGNYWSHIS